MTNAEARFSNSLRPRKPEGSLGRTAQDGHLDSHTAPEPFSFGSEQDDKSSLKTKNYSGADQSILSCLTKFGHWDDE